MKKNNCRQAILAGRFLTKNRAGSNIAYNYTNADNKIENIILNGSSYSFAYDTKGSLTNDGLNNVLLGNYSFRNLPTTMNNFSYTYNDSGERIKKQNVDSLQSEYYLRDYLGRELVIYNYETNDPKQVNIYGSDLVGKIEIDTTETRSYYLKDHIGNVRCVLNSDGAVLNAQDYYPYGETIRQFNSSRYMLTEKERDTESGNDYGVYPAICGGARYYNSKLGVWLQVDPLSEKYPGWSPYNYTLNNPINLIDEYGLDAEDPEKKNKETILPEIVVVGERPQEPWAKWAQSVLLARAETKDNIEKTWESIKAGNRYTTPYYLVKSILSLIDLSLKESAPLPIIGTISTNTWNAISVGRPLSKMGHAAKHLEHFREISPSLTDIDVAKILEAVKQNPSSVIPTTYGATAYKAAVEINGKIVDVKVIVSSSGIIKTGYPLK